MLGYTKDKDIQMDIGYQRTDVLRYIELFYIRLKYFFRYMESSKRRFKFYMSVVKTFCPLLIGPGGFKE